MANPEHLAILRKGGDAWNDWRRKAGRIRPDFRGADLHGLVIWEADLSEADLRGCNLERVSLDYARLVNADLSEVQAEDAELQGADLGSAWLTRAVLTGAGMNGCHLRMAKLEGARLNKAALASADFGGSLLKNTNFTNANLDGACFQFSRFSDVDFQGAVLASTVFADCDLSGARNLDRCIHGAPSSPDFATLLKSKDLPEAFLRGCGLPDVLIAYLGSLRDVALDLYSCFISYSSQEEAFARRLHADLQTAGVRCWFAPENLRIGDRFRAKIDEAIRLRDKLLIVLSEASIRSPWVEKEVESALEEERRRGCTVLFPIRLDDAAMSETAGWAADIRRTRYIGDFTQWKSHDAYQTALQRLLHDLRQVQPS